MFMGDLLHALREMRNEERLTVVRMNLDRNEEHLRAHWEARMPTTWHRQERQLVARDSAPKLRANE